MNLFMGEAAVMVLHNRRMMAKRVLESGYRFCFQEAKHALEKAKVEFAKIIEGAKEESQKIVADSKHQANDQTKKLLEKAQMDAWEIIAKAQGVLAVEKEKMLIDFRESLEKSVK